MEFSTSRVGGVATLRIVGELDAVTTPNFRPFLDALVAERHPRVVVDVSGPRLIDSSGRGRRGFPVQEGQGVRRRGDRPWPV